MIDIVRSKNEGFCTYSWTKPGREGDDFKIIAYVKKCSAFDGFIGTGVYLDDLEAGMQKTISFLVILFQSGYFFLSCF